MYACGTRSLRHMYCVQIVKKHHVHAHIFVCFDSHDICRRVCLHRHAHINAEMKDPRSYVHTYMHTYIHTKVSRARTYGACTHTYIHSHINAEMKVCVEVRNAYLRRIVCPRDQLSPGYIVHGLDAALGKRNDLANRGTTEVH
jgi:hypothetical protein